MVNKHAKVRCWVSGCENNAPGAKDVSFFIVPKDSRRREWLKAMRIKYTMAAKILVCELHFEPDAVIGNVARKRVVFGRLPTLRLPPPTEPLVCVLPPRTTNHVQASDAPEIKAEPLHADSVIDFFTVEETAVAQKRPLPSETEVFAFSLNDIPLKRERIDHQDDYSQVEDYSVGSCTRRHPPHASVVDDGGRPAGSLSAAAPVHRARSIPANSTVNLELFIELSRQFLIPELANFVEGQAFLKNELKSAFESKRCSEEIIFFALKLYHFFPQTYKVMGEYFGMPPTLHIKRQCRSLSWEINDTWERVLRARFERASATQRECVLCVARVELRLRVAYDSARDRMIGLDEVDGAQRSRSARHAVVVYARGILSRWQQPLSYALLAPNTPPEEVWIWLDIVTSKLLDIGLNVRALVTDVDDNYIPTVRRIHPDKTYFQVKDRQIYLFYDCTQLMVKFRDVFMKRLINFRGMIASWEVIEELHDYDSTRRYKLAPALTARHVRPPPSCAARADLAVQVLSPQVATAIAAAVDLRVLDDSAHGTVQLITAFNTLYEILHRKELAMTGNKITPDMKFLNEMLMNFERITFLDGRNRKTKISDPGVIRAFSANVRAALALQERMRRAGHAALPMRAFNNDLLRRLVDRARDNSHKPTPRQLVDAFRRSFGFHVMKPFSAAEGKLDVFLEMAGGIRDIIVEGTEEVSKIALARTLAKEVKPWHYMPLIRGRPTPPVARFLLAQCLIAKPCCGLGAAYCKQPLAPQPCVDFLSALEVQFRAYFSTECLPEAVLASLLRAADGTTLSTPCPCFPVLFLKALYFRFRIAHLINFNNTKYKEYASRYFTMNILNH